MRIFAIADLHLSGEPPFKPMEVFGEAWCNHWEKIKKSWKSLVTEDDLVLLLGDISWAMSMQDADADLGRITQLPGNKVMLRGNHDYWWSSLSKLNSAYGKDIFFLQNNFFVKNNIAICGSRGWTLPNTEGYTKEDEKIYKRELLRLELSLNKAEQAGITQKILAMHFPPVINTVEHNEITALCAKYAVKHCLYGHLHGEQGFATAFNGVFNNTSYNLVSCDNLNFKLFELVY